MVLVTSPEADPSEYDDLRILPESAHEVSTILLLTINGHTTAVGDLNEDLSNLSNVLVRLGTKVSESYPSSVGFRVFLRTEVPKSNTGSIEDHYHVVSCKFDPTGGTMIYRRATAEDKQELIKSRPFRKSFMDALSPSENEHLYRMEFESTDTNAFELSRHGPALQTKNGHIRKIDKLLPFIAYASKLSLIFIADRVLTRHLYRAIGQDCIGAESPSWKSAIPSTAIIEWPSATQTQMVTGSTDILNVLLMASHRPPLRDGSGTSVQERPEALQFRQFVQHAYPSARSEPAPKVYPIMLSVAHSLCVELPFGASMLNRENTYTAINALHGLLAAKVVPSRIGIITLYPAQVEAYQDALARCHKYAPTRGYDLVVVDVVEGWVKKTVGVAIVDLVRTSNAGGNLGYLSQATRLNVLLTLHENGLIIVGDRNCTTTSYGTITSTKLEKLLQWLSDNGRMVGVSDKGLPLSMEKATSTDRRNTPIKPIVTDQGDRAEATSADQNAPATPSSPDQTAHPRTSSVSSTSTAQRWLYVGIPGLEHLTIDKPTSENARAPIGRRGRTMDRDAARASYERQGFLATETSQPRNAHLHSYDAAEAPVPYSSKKGDDLAPAGSRQPEAWASFARQGFLPPNQHADTLSSAKGFLSAIGDDASTRQGVTTSKLNDPGRLNEKSKVDSVPRGYLATAVDDAAPKGDSADMKIPDLIKRGTKGGAKETGLPGIKKPNPFAFSPAKSKAHELLTSPMADEVEYKVEGLTKRFKFEFGLSTHTDSKENSKDFRPESGLATLGLTRPALSFDLSNAMATTTTSPTTPGKENGNPQKLAKGKSPSRLHYKLEDSNSPEPTAKFQPHTAAVKPLPHEAAFKIPATSHMNKGTSVQTPAIQSQTAASNKASGKDAFHGARRSVQAYNDRARSLGQSDWQASYRAKYQNLRNLFAVLKDIPRDRTEEDKLFRTMAEAHMNEDIQAFDRCFGELLKILQGVGMVKK